MTCSPPPSQWLAESDAAPEEHRPSSRPSTPSAFSAGTALQLLPSSAPDAATGVGGPQVAPRSGHQRGDGAAAEGLGAVATDRDCNTLSNPKPE